uniref:roundabout homolog 1-like isoform X3 n=1 Tax=Myxine glutinosa TaxID=7769 RepID=UPI00358F61D3
MDPSRPVPRCSLGLLILAMSHAAGSRLHQDDYPPRILEHPSDFVVSRGDPATLYCKAEGRPSPSIEWFKDGERLDKAKDDQRIVLPSGALFFLSVLPGRRSKSDEGSYVCVARNYLGEVTSHNASLQIAMLRDDFRQSPSDVVAAAGEPAILECQPPRGHPEPSVSWKKDGAVLKGGDPRIEARGWKLIISDVQRSDAGHYSCVASNRVGRRESDSALLVVLERPTFTRRPLSQLVAGNESVEFVCQADGDPPPHISWIRRDGEMPRGRWEELSDGKLRIHGVRPSDEGTYACLAENRLGQAEATASLSVHEGSYVTPKFLEQPRDKVVPEGRTASFSCLATGTPPPTVFWQREGTQLLLFPNQPLQATNRLWVSASGDLSVSDVRPSDSGYYVCQALSVAGSVIARAYLDVTDVTPENLPPILLHVPPNQTVPLGSTALLPCQAAEATRRAGSRASQPAVIFWLRDGVKVPALDGHFVQQEGRLLIRTTRLEDSGVYTCVARNSNGETTWNSFLQVKGSKRHDGGTSPLQTWPLRSPSRVRVVRATRNSVSLVWQASHGPTVMTYIVEAFSRSLGPGWTVVGADLRQAAHTVQDLRPGSVFVFIVRAVGPNGISEPSPISDPVRTQDASAPRRGLDHGTILWELGRLTIRLKEPEVFSSTTLRLNWLVSHNMLYVQGYRVLFRHLGIARVNGNWSTVDVKSPTEHSAVLSRLRKGTTYEIKVRAFFDGFQGPDSNVQLCVTQEEAPSAAPQDIHLERCKEADCDSVMVSWKPPPEDKHNGDLLEYKVWCLSEAGVLHLNRSTAASKLNLELRPIIPGTTYLVVVAASNRAGNGVHSSPVKLPALQAGQGGQIGSLVKEPLFVGVAGAVLGLILIALAAWLYCRCRQKNHPDPYHGATKDPSFTFTPTVTFSSKDDGGLLSSSYQGYSGAGQLWGDSWQGVGQRSNPALPDYCRPVDHLSNLHSLEQKESNLNQPGTPDTSIYHEVEPILSPCPSFASSKPGDQPLNIGVPRTVAYAALPTGQPNICNNMSSTARVGEKRPPRGSLLPRPEAFGTKNQLAELSKLNNDIAAAEKDRISASGSHEQSTMGSHASSDRSTASSGAHSGRKKNARTSKSQRPSMPIGEPLPPPPALPPTETDGHQLPSDRRDLNCFFLSEHRGYPQHNNDAGEHEKYEEEEEEEDDDEEQLQTHKANDGEKGRGFAGTVPTSCAYAEVTYPPCSYSMQPTAPCSPTSPEERRPILQRGQDKRGPVSTGLTKSTRHCVGHPLLTCRSPSPPYLYGYIAGPSPSDLETDAAEEHEEQVEEDEEEDEGVNFGKRPTPHFDAKKLLLSLEQTSISSLGDPESSLAGSMLNGWGSASEGEPEEDGRPPCSSAADSSDCISSESSFHVDANFADAIAAAAQSSGIKLQAQPGRGNTRGRPGVAGVTNTRQGQALPFAEDFVLYSRPHFPSAKSRPENPGNSMQC